jgi:hypothetical protein
VETPQKDTLFSVGKAKWLLQNVEKLDPDERALLLAISELEKDTGRDLTPEEQAALDKLSAAVSDFDPREIAKAVDHMITAETKRHPVEEWPLDIQRRLKQKKEGKKDE